MTHDTKLAACEGKIGFDGYGAASRANRHGGNNRPYRCLFCGKWHLGTWSRKKVEARPKSHRLPTGF